MFDSCSSRRSSRPESCAQFGGRGYAVELVVWAYNRATCRATRCASRCSGWQGRSAAGVTLPVVKGVRGSPSADAVREGSAGADPKSDRSIVPRNAREEVTFAGGAHCDLYDLYTRGGMWREWRSLSGGANRGSPVGCLQRLTAYKGGRAVDHEIMGMTSRGREKSGGRKVWESRWGCTPNCGGEGQETRTVAGRDLVFS